MMDCKLTRGPCSGKPAPPPPPCPPPPPFKFPWIYPIIVGTIMTVMGLIYQYYLWCEDQKKNVFNKPVWRPRAKLKRPVHEKDLPDCVQYLIIGTGAAGWAGYRGIADHDPKAKVFFITKEDSYPYKRPPMSKYMFWNGDPPDMRFLNYLDSNNAKKSMYYAGCKSFMDPVMFFRKKTGPAVSIATGWCVLKVDADDHVVWVKTLCGVRPIYYERLLLAPGSKAKNLSIFKNASHFIRERVSTMRTVRDLELVYRRVRNAKHVTIIGGGPMGCELAYYLGRMHKEWFPPPDDDYVPPKIVHVFKDKGVLSGIIPEYLGEWAAEKIKCANVNIMPRACVYDAFKTNDDRIQLTLSNGKSITTDYILVAVGAAPRDELAWFSDLELDPVHGGYKVNTEMMARKHLYIAGDAASYYSQWKQYNMRLEHYLNAQEQGYIAGANMAGYWIPNNTEPHFWLTLGQDINMEVIGEAGACMATVGLFKPCDTLQDDLTLAGKVYERKMGEFDKPCYKESMEYRYKYRRGIVFYLRDDIVVGMALWNIVPIPDRKDVVTELLRAKPTYKDIQTLAQLVDFEGVICMDVPGEIVHPPGPCIDREKSHWMTKESGYEEYEKRGALSKVEQPETVIYVNNPPGSPPKFSKAELLKESEGSASK